MRPSEVALRLLADYVALKRSEWVDACLKVLSKLKCHRCGWCCKNIPVNVNLDDVQLLSLRVLGRVDVVEFASRFTVFYSKFMPYLKTPCPFYHGKCVVYSSRPDVCRVFPFDISLPVIHAVDKCRLASDIHTALSKLQREAEPDFLMRFIGEEDRRVGELLRKAGLPVPKTVEDVVESWKRTAELINEYTRENLDFAKSGQAVDVWVSPVAVKALAEWLAEKRRGGFKWV